MWLLYGILTAFFGWTGGRGDDYWKEHQKWPRWLLQSWTRDWIIAPLCALFAFLYGVHSWWLILLIPATGGALSTYHDSYFGFDNFWMHGFVIGLASFPVAIVNGEWVMWFLRALLLAVWMGGWSASWKNDHIEDLGRYFAIGATMWMIC